MTIGQRDGQRLLLTMAPCRTTLNAECYPAVQSEHSAGPVQPQLILCLCQNAAVHESICREAVNHIKPLYVSAGHVLHGWSELHL